jgi:hypothetical protein
MGIRTRAEKPRDGPIRAAEKSMRKGAWHSPIRPAGKYMQQMHSKVVMGMQENPYGKCME